LCIFSKKSQKNEVHSGNTENSKNSGSDKIFRQFVWARKGSGKRSLELGEGFPLQTSKEGNFYITPYEQI